MSGIVTLITTPKIVTFGPLALKHINLTLHISGSIHFKYLATLILTNHGQSVLDKALPPLNSLR